MLSFSSVSIYKVDKCMTPSVLKSVQVLSHVMYSLKSDIIIFGSKLSIRLQKQTTNGAKITFGCAVILPKYYQTEIFDGQTMIHLLLIV